MVFEYIATGHMPRRRSAYIQRQIATANTINVERGIANDGGLTGGTDQWSTNPR